MKKIQLPISQTVSITIIDEGKLVAGAQNNPDKNGMLSLGTLIDSNNVPETLSLTSHVIYFEMRTHERFGEEMRLHLMQDRS